MKISFLAFLLTFGMPFFPKTSDSFEIKRIGDNEEIEGNPYLTEEVVGKLRSQVLKDKAENLQNENLQSMIDYVNRSNGDDLLDDALEDIVAHAIEKNERGPIRLNNKTLKEILTSRVSIEKELRDLNGSLTSLKNIISQEINNQKNEVEQKLNGRHRSLEEVINSERERQSEDSPSQPEQKATLEDLLKDSFKNQDDQPQTQPSKTILEKVKDYLKKKWQEDCKWDFTKALLNVSQNWIISIITGVQSEEEIWFPGGKVKSCQVIELENDAETEILLSSEDFSDCVFKTLRENRLSETLNSKLVVEFTPSFQSIETPNTSETRTATIFWQPFPLDEVIFEENPSIFKKAFIAAHKLVRPFIMKYDVSHVKHHYLDHNLTIVYHQPLRLSEILDEEIPEVLNPTVKELTLINRQIQDETYSSESKFALKTNPEFEGSIFYELVKNGSLKSNLGPRTLICGEDAKVDGDTFVGLDQLLTPTSEESK